MRTSLFIFLLGVFISPVYSQITYLTENQISYDLLHWHYDKYNNAQNDEWYKKTIDGEEYFGVKFTFEEAAYEAIYNASGKILSEKKILSEDDVPEEIINVLDYRIVKYKIKEYLTETYFENRNPAEVYHMVDARTKTGGQVLLWFDSEFNVIQNKKDRIAFN